MTDAARKGTVLSVQYLRGLAAMLVVLHHARNPAPWLFSPLAGYKFGEAGVDIFFFISGFIMWTAARNEPVWEFARRRFVRVAPLYWLTTLGFLAFAIAATPAEVVGWSALELIQSLLFIPHFSAAHPGEIWPILVPGWTLNYEMFFYAIFALGLFTRRVLLTVPLLILALVSLGLATHPTSPIYATYTSPLLLEFLGGLFIGTIYHGLSSKLWPLLPTGLLALVAVVSPNAPEAVQAVARFFASGAVLVGSLALERHLQGPLRLPMLLGNASYSIYLSHAITLQFVRAAWKHIPLHGWAQFLSFLVTAAGASTIVGWVVFVCAERPIVKLLSARNAAGPAFTPASQLKT